MDELYRNLGAHSYWGVDTNEAVVTFDTSEIWIDQASGKASSKLRTVSVSELEAWLGEVSRGDGPAKQTLAARFVRLQITKDKRITLSRDVWKKLLKAFGLELAYSYSRSCINGITALPKATGPDAAELQAYSFTYLPKLAALWSHKSPPTAQQPSSSTSIVSGIVLSDPSYEVPLKLALQSPWTAGVCGHAMFLPFCISLSFGALVDQTHHHVKTALRGIEDMTGFHAFHREATKQPNEVSDLAEKLAERSKESNGYATKMASVARKAKMITYLTKFIERSIEEEEKAVQSVTAAQPASASASQPASSQSETPTGSSLLRKHAQVVGERLVMQEMDMEYTRKRLEVQIDALFNLVTWNDSLSNLALSRSTHEIAEASYRDASSMKTLAIVTMLFLPGSFVSSLFSTDLFDWDARDLLSSNISVKSTPQMRLYWAITIPLTVATLVAYSAWLWYQKRHREEDRERRWRRVEQADRARRATSMERATSPLGVPDGGKNPTMAYELNHRRRMTLAFK